MIGELFSMHGPQPCAVEGVLEYPPPPGPMLGHGCPKSPMGSENIICWNVRGLNLGAHHYAVRELVREEHISLVCLQVMNMHVITNYDNCKSWAQDLSTSTSLLARLGVGF
jgi:hypothetical protein